MLFSLKVKSIQLMTNNPRKIEDLARHGVVITGRIPVVIPPNPHNEFYLKTKAQKSGHLLDGSGKLHLQEQTDHAILPAMTADQVAQLHQD